MARYEVSALWTRVPDDVEKRVFKALDAGLLKSPEGRATVFFRADDVAVPGTMCEAMFQVFRDRGVPLCAALVPVWTTGDRWKVLKNSAGSGGGTWCWHQHGWLHRNHEPEGRKYEFGPSRSREAIARDLSRGRDRLQSILGGLFTPVFTPPWNRMSLEAMECLLETGFSGLSRDHTARPDPPEGLAEYRVNVDLHTRKEPDASSGWDGLLTSVTDAAATGTIGFMLHHQRMNRTAAEMLDMLVTCVCSHPQLTVSIFS